MISEKYSFKDFTGWDLSDRKDMEGITIEGSCFSNQTPDARIFPAGMKNTTFNSCNLDNVFIPSGNTVMDNCRANRFKVQNDGEDWIIDANTKKPIEPVNKKGFLYLGLSIDPKDIPAKKQTKSIVAEKMAERAI